MNSMTVGRSDGRSMALSMMLGLVLGVTFLVYIVGLPLWMPLGLIINSAVAQSGVKIPFDVGLPATFVLAFLVSGGIVALVTRRMGADALVSDKVATAAPTSQAVGWFIKREMMGSELPPEGTMVPLIHIREPEGLAHMIGDEFWNARVEIVPSSVKLSDGWLLGWKGVYELPEHHPIRPDQMLWLGANGEIWIARLADPINDPSKVKIGAMAECRPLR